ncbi:hypothetical protein OSB04_013386 [Centaurea solstitialis]|uniref:Uncharacterized protein n=1 Tax=Centaurea solstitialis TaxID=347529 RepID=A0AA38WEY5_9ASTR|nr:hypothetical protein OSB04_013386 [Centaurea solstitialis]
MRRRSEQPTTHATCREYRLEYRVRVSTQFSRSVLDSVCCHFNMFQQGKVHRFVEGLRVNTKRYVEVTIPKTFLQGDEVAKIVKKNSERPTEVGRGVKRKWDDNSKGSKIAKFGFGLEPKENRSNCPTLQKDTAWSMRLESGASRSGNMTKEILKAKGA